MALLGGGVWWSAPCTEASQCVVGIRSGAGRGGQGVRQTYEAISGSQTGQTTELWGSILFLLQGLLVRRPEEQAACFSGAARGGAGRGMVGWVGFAVSGEVLSRQTAQRSVLTDSYRTWSGAQQQWHLVAPRTGPPPSH